MLSIPVLFTMKISSRHFVYILNIYTLPTQRFWFEYLFPLELRGLVSTVLKILAVEILSYNLKFPITQRNFI